MTLLIYLEYLPLLKFKTKTETKYSFMNYLSFKIPKFYFVYTNGLFLVTSSEYIILILYLRNFKIFHNVSPWVFTTSI